jgi:ABC-2 type transport system permease protein
MKTDLRNMTADRTLLIVALLFIVVISYGLYNGAAWVDRQKETLAATAREEAERTARLKAEIVGIERGEREPGPFSDPRAPSRVGGSLGARYAAMPPAALAAFSVGQSDIYPYYFQVSTRSKQTFLNNDEIENPTNLLAGKFDLAFVLIYLCPLLILAISYNILSAEKEQGTLQMTLAQPVSLRTIVFSKIFGRVLIALSLTIIPTVTGFLLTDEIEDGSLSRLALWALVAGSYAAFWFALALAVNALGKSSATNALALAGLWLLFVMIIPSLVSVASTALYPVPSRVEMVQAMRSASKLASARGSQLLAKYYEDHPELVPGSGSADMDDFAARSIAVQDEVEREIQPVLARFDDQLFRQQALVSRFRFISPALIAQTALNDISGSGLERYRHFLNLVDEYHARWSEYFRSRVFRKVLLREADYDEMPRFEFKEESSSTVARRAFAGWAGLATFAVLISLYAAARLRRYLPVG